MAKKKKKPTLAVLISSQEGLEAALNRYISASLELKEQKAAQEKEIADLKTKFGLESKSLNDEVLSLESGIQLYCITHRADLFPTEKKSREFSNATIGFRLSPHAVGKVLEKDTWDRIAERICAAEWGEPYINTVVSVNKEELLKDRADLKEEQLAEVGVTFTQAENFYIEPNSDVLDASRKPVESGVAA